MLLQLQKYVLIQHKPGKEMILADTLSHEHIKEGNQTQTTLEEELRCMIHMVLSSGPFTDAKLEEVRTATKDSTIARILQSIIQNGWPDKIAEAPEEI